MIMINDINNNVYIYILLMGVAPNPESSKVTPVTPSSKLLPRKLLLTPLIPQRYPVGLDHQAAMALWLQGSYALPTLHLTTGSLSLRFLRHSKLNWR